MDDMSSRPGLANLDVVQIIGRNAKLGLRVV